MAQKKAGELKITDLKASDNEATIGRIVYAFAPGAVVGSCPAVVTKVAKGNIVNVRCHPDAEDNPNLQYGYPLSGVVLCDPIEESARPKSGAWCEWMPYQKGQAEKAKQLEEQLAASQGAAGSEAS